MQNHAGELDAQVGLLKEMLASKDEEVCHLARLNEQLRENHYKLDSDYNDDAEKFQTSGYPPDTVRFKTCATHGMSRTKQYMYYDEKNDQRICYVRRGDVLEADDELDRPKDHDSQAAQAPHHNLKRATQTTLPAAPLLRIVKAKLPSLLLP